MSARQRAPQRTVSPRLKIASWSGTLSRTDTITGSLICNATGWRMALTGTLDGARIIHLTARFDSPTFADDAAPWTDEHEVAKPHEARSAGYVCEWVGSIRKNDAGAWTGEMGDRYGGRLTLTGKTQGPGVISLRATASVGERG